MRLKFNTKGVYSKSFIIEPRKRYKSRFMKKFFKDSNILFNCCVYKQLDKVNVRHLLKSNIRLYGKQDKMYTQLKSYQNESI